MAAGFLAGFTFLTFGFGLSGPAVANKASDRLVALGLANLKSGQYTVAAKYFNGARQVDKKDARALFYLGVALNRLGQHGAALESFNRMLKLKLAHRELGLEAGWAAIARGQSGLAVRMLEPYVARNPRHAKAREFLGRAYLGQGKLDDAERELKTALKLNPGLKPTVTYYQANVAAARGDAAKSGKILGSILKDTPDSAVSSALQQQLRQAAADERKGAGVKPWSVFGAFSVGHNDNVIALSDQIVRPTDITSIKSNYALYEMGGRY
ncbi:MAG: tetratricopeptide repeat protein [Alphaproteobacteria bacterium]